ncbi:Uncharacterised protein [Legionella beliardensis]|uniref:Transmembrane protein n=1 Tax=Legionella beliardensis TaxID=91822 RepID=A0A378I3F8_9GAMM|nr:hypothetical protein [Legionella beliardensis]STX29717.1 Uncharacterised protein [Legionella beliardensis]
MTGKTEICGISLGVGAIGGAVVGGLGGLGVGIWTCVQYIQPALEETDALSVSAASGITALIAICGLLEASASLGSCAGAAAGAIVTPVAAGIGYCASGVASATKGLCSSGFFSKNKNNNQEAAPAPEAEEQAPTGPQLV